MSKRWFIWLRNAVLALVILAFVAFFGMPSGRSTPGVVAEVDGEPIRREVFEVFRSQIARLQDLPADADPAALQNALDQRALESVISRAVLAREGAE